jgi:hypothetical protein
MQTLADLTVPISRRRQWWNPGLGPAAARRIEAFFAAYPALTERACLDRSLFRALKRVCQHRRRMRRFPALAPHQHGLFLFSGRPLRPRDVD